MTVENLVPLLQTAISPVILISALGLLLLTMNNRLAHAIDRIRGLSKEAENAAPQDRLRLQSQVQVLWRRTRLLRYAIELATLSALCAAFLVVALFVTELFGWRATGLIATPFVVSLMALIGSLALLIIDVRKSLLALQLELQDPQTGEYRTTPDP